MFGFVRYGLVGQISYFQQFYRNKFQGDSLKGFQNSLERRGKTANPVSFTVRSVILKFLGAKSWLKRESSFF